MPWEFYVIWISLLSSVFVVTMHKDASHHNGRFEGIQRGNSDRLLKKTHMMKGISQDDLLL